MLALPTGHFNGRRFIFLPSPPLYHLLCLAALRVTSTKLFLKEKRKDRRQNSSQLTTIHFAKMSGHFEKIVYILEHYVILYKLQNESK